MKKILLGLLIAALFAVTSVAETNVTINGAGATFPYPIYSQWAHKYNQMTGLQMNYQSIGSGGGIAQIKAKTVDFGATDAPLSVEELNQIGLIQFPMVVGGVVPVVNIQGVANVKLKLTPAILADIFLGKIKKWNDPAIKKINSGLNLPDKDITVVHRADGSGTTHIFTSFLALVSPEWKSKVGAGKAVEWPTGVGGKGNEGVAAFVQKVDGSIGYVEYAYAEQNKIACAVLQNRDGNFVTPAIGTFQAAAASADWKNAPGFNADVLNQPGKESWPITGATFILLYKDQPNMEKAKSMLKFFSWCLRSGGVMAKSLDYVPLPKAVVDMIENLWKNEVKSGGKPVWP